MIHFSKVASSNNMEAEAGVFHSTAMVLTRQHEVDRPVIEVRPTERAATVMSRSEPRHLLGVRDQVWRRPEAGSEADWNIVSYGRRLMARANLHAHFSYLLK
jgi:hypothetical protein